MLGLLGPDVALLWSGLGMETGGRKTPVSTDLFPSFTTVSPPRAGQSLLLLCRCVFRTLGFPGLPRSTGLWKMPFGGGEPSLPLPRVTHWLMDLPFVAQLDLGNRRHGTDYALT